MEAAILMLYACLSVISLVIAFKLLFRGRTCKNLPPGPPSIPILGHLRLLKPPLHRTFSDLAQKYGPIISLKFGYRRVVVVSSLSIAQDCFTTHDTVLANRPRFATSKYIAYDNTTVTTAPYGDLWRNLRRICTVEILSTNRLNTFSGIRQDEVKRLLQKLALSSGGSFAKVQLRPLFTILTYNNIMRMMTGKRYYGEDLENEEKAKLFKGLMEDILTISGAENLSDYVPMLRWFYSKFENKVKMLHTRMDAFLQGLIDEHRSEKSASNSMIDHLLSLRESQPEYYTDRIIKGLIQAMLLAGTDTSSITLEWAMANLVNNPDVLKQAKAELDIQVGEDRLIDEADLANCPYLQNIISETLRLHPPVPLLIPHLTSEDCIISGYKIPGETMVLFNAWAIHRDPELWDDPESFNPGRFEIGEEAARKLLPFGGGRRFCAGLGLAKRILGLSLGTLIQCFDWKGVKEGKIEMTEKAGLVKPMVEPLELMCRTRPGVSKLLPQD